MIVHSCCCIGVFVMFGLIQIQNPFENFFGKSFENKKKRQSLPPSLFLSFGPTGLASLVGPSPSAYLLAARSSRVGPLLSPPLFSATGSVSPAEPAQSPRSLVFPRADLAPPLQTAQLHMP